MIDLKEIEGSLLGVIIKNPSTLEQITNEINKDMLLCPEHQVLYDALLVIEEIELVSVKNYLKERGLLDAAGGMQYIGECWNAGFQVGSIDYYIKTIKEYHHIRLLERHTQYITEVTHDPDLSAIQKQNKIEIDYREKFNGPVTQDTPYDELTQEIEDTIAGKLVSVPMPWEALTDSSNCLLPGTVTLLCGTPGASKSFMLLQAITYWVANGFECVCFELEETTKYYLHRILAQIASMPGITDKKWVKANPQESRNAHKEYKEILIRLGEVIHAQPEQQVTLSHLAHWIHQQASSGKRIVCVDPVTIATYSTRQTWLEDGDFLERIKRSAVEYGASVLLVTHPVKNSMAPGLDTLAGGAAYSRFCQAAIWLEYHAPKESDIQTCLGRSVVEHNRTAHILKARNGMGHGARIAFNFEKDNLTLTEEGVIIPERK